MVNLFEKRTTEFYRNDEAFLSVVTPEPLVTFLRKPAQEERLYDRLTVIVGTPGSGKTTLARLFQYRTLMALLRSSGNPDRKSMIDALGSCGAIGSERPTLLGCRIPLESEYREFWELPYPDQIKNRLMLTLIQARTVLGWLRNIKSAGVALDRVSIVPRADASAAVTAIGGRTGLELFARAQQVELAIYRISAALLPPRLEDADEMAVAAYRPFDAIDSFRIQDEDGDLRPLVILDDAHLLHDNQLTAARDFLARRELKVARWVLTRLDALSPDSVLTRTGVLSKGPGLNRPRETTVIWMQGGLGERADQRRSFRKMSKDMAGRYLSQMDVFNRRGLRNLGALMSGEPHPIPAGKREQLEHRVNSLQRKCGVSGDRRLELEGIVDRYLAGAEDSHEDLRLAILAVLFERYAKRTPQQMQLDNASADAEPSRPLGVDSGVADGARIHLLHEYGRPYYYGVDTLCDASSENAEQFLRLAGRLVDQVQTQLIRREVQTLASRAQHKLLRKRADEMIEDWDFPECRRVRRLVDGIAAECLDRSLEGNASLRGGANAFGIPQADFTAIPDEYPKLARVLQFGVAYNAFSLVPRYATKKSQWCLIELGGIPILSHGLTLKRGGFLERRAGDLDRFLGED